MALFGKKAKGPAPSNSMNMSMSLVEAAMQDDPSALLAAFKSAGDPSVPSFFNGLVLFYQRISPNLTPEQKDAMRDEISRCGGTPEIRAAVCAVVVPAIVDLDSGATTAAIKNHADVIRSQAGDFLLETVLTAARVNKRLAIKLNWSAS